MNKTKITKSDLRRLAMGEMPLTLMGVPFIIMRQSVGLRHTEEQSTQWNLDTSPDEEDSIVIDRATAIDIIESQHMELAFTKSYGQIYELPGRPYLETYNRRRAGALAS